MDSAQVEVASREELFDLVLVERTEYISESGPSIAEIVEQDRASRL